MYLKNISENPITTHFTGGIIESNEFNYFSENKHSKEAFLEVEQLMLDDLVLVSTSQFEDGLLSKESSLRYVKNYTIDKSQYRIYDRVFAYSQYKNLGDINYIVDVHESLYFTYFYLFGRKLRKIGYWYNNGIPSMEIPVIQIDYNYKFDVAGLVSSIEKNISFFRKDGTIDKDVKKTVKVYDFLQRGKEQRSRREYIYREITGIAQVALVSSGQYTTDDIVNITESFVVAINELINSYIDNGIYQIVSILKNKSILELQLLFAVSGLGFLNLEYQGQKLKDLFASLLDYRSEEEEVGLENLYRGSDL